jgi:DNA-directed RNA polymerase specialized sigma24 family protein
MKKKHPYYSYFNEEEQFILDLKSQTRNAQDQIKKYYFYWIEQGLQKIGTSNFIPQITENIITTILKKRNKINSRDNLEKILFQEIQLLSTNRLTVNDTLEINTTADLHLKFREWLAGFKDILSQLRKLPVKYKTPIHQRFLQKDIEEIAETIAKEKQEVQKNIQEGLELLKTRLKNNNKALTVYNETLYNQIS